MENQVEESRFAYLEIDDEPQAQPVVVAAPAAPIAPAPVTAFIPPLRMVAGKSTAMGVLMSPRMNRFYTFLADNNIGISDWSTDTSVIQNFSKLQALVIKMEAEVAATNGEISRQECLVDLKGIMNRIPANRQDGTNVTPPAAVEVEAKNYTMVKDAAESTGSILFWRLTGQVVVAELAAKLRDLGLSEKFMPTETTPGMAFLRAVEELRERQVLVRRHPAGGFCVIEEKVVNNELDYRKCCRVFLEEEVVKCEAIDYTQVEAQNVQEQVGRFYSHALKTFNHSELSSYLVACVKRLKGVTFTRGGGFYYLGKNEAQTMTMIQGVIESLGGSNGSKIYLIPVSESKAAVRAVFDAIAIEIGGRFDEMQNELNVGTGKRAATNRLEELDEMATNIKHYEGLLGADFKALKTRRDALVKGYRDATGEGTGGRAQNLEVE